MKGIHGDTLWHWPEEIELKGLEGFEQEGHQVMLFWPDKVRWIVIRDSQVIKALVKYLQSR